MLVIDRAYYGRGNNYADVTSQLQSLVENGENIDITVNPKTMGADPSIGSEKTLSVAYVADGKTDRKQIVDGSNFAVYTKKKEDEGPRAVAGEATSDIFSTLVKSFGTFLHLAGVGIAYKVGNELFGEIPAYIMTAIAVVIPFWGLWGVPLLVFVYRLFTDTDVVPAAVAAVAAPATAATELVATT